MLKWSPEPFDIERPAPGQPDLSAAVFESAADSSGTERASMFRREAGFTDTRSLMGSLTQEERSQVYELVEIDLETEYKEREAALTAELEERLAAARVETTEMVDRWTAAIAAALATEMREAAAASARLAVEIAAKIVRQAVAVDPGALARVIETTLFKVAESQPLTIRANPAEAAWLESQDSLRQRLNIGQVVSDRRIEAGGCVVQAGNREWDATLERQLDTIAEIVSESIATESTRPLALPNAGPPPAANAPEDGHEPGVE